MENHLKILYKTTAKGQIQQWNVVIGDDYFYTIEGIVGGKLTQSLPTYCKGKNIGRSNETTASEQAEAEAYAKHQKKLDAMYAEAGMVAKKFVEPMLAHEYKDYSHLLFTVPTYVQPKLDGIRCLNEKNTLMSRKGKPFVACPHLYQDEVLLDGELYSHDYKDDFNKIVSLCKREKPTKEEIAETAEKVQMWLYDFPNHNGVFSERLKALHKWWETTRNHSFMVVPTYRIRSLEELYEYHAQFISGGYEGTIIRMDLGPYEYKRSKQLLKFKDFVDSEFEIIGYEEGTGGRAGTIGVFILNHDKDDGKTFRSNVKGNFAYLKDVWNHKEDYIGKLATVRYPNRTPLKEDGSGDIPRFPFITKINRGSYE